ncbi:hypothetical protein EXE58_15720 [Nocardioides seonyuensis]|uniref:Uncharacterized protein n=1 Tax=Nocardioides seonyuensis TaxID=2518371 RepID=A0A4V1BML2_9ACTN|nr:hypothetical protein [Nocardioides seonyuensis]QBX56762.1 hypothetical protein EXE58_15720 [Nocardioides seonyuensis]
MITVAATVGTRRPLRAPTAARAASPMGLAVLIAALVVGILGMHALASHGTPAAPAASNATSMTGTTSDHHPAMPSVDSHEGHVPSAGPHSTDAVTGGGGDPGSGPGHDMASMVMQCIGMLAAAALPLLARLAVGFVRPLRPAVFLPADVLERTFHWVRSTGPPSVWQFSVIRC